MCTGTGSGHHTRYTSLFFNASTGKLIKSVNIRDCCRIARTPGNIESRTVASLGADQVVPRIGGAQSVSCRVFVFALGCALFIPSG